MPQFIDTRMRPIEKPADVPIHWRVGVYAIIVNDAGEILFVTPHWSPSQLEIPGGGVEEGEEMLAALRREVAEETGLTISLESDEPHFTRELFYYSDFTGKYYHQIMLVYLAKPAGPCTDLLDREGQAEIISTAWVSVTGGIPEHCHGFSRPFIERYRTSRQSR